MIDSIEQADGSLEALLLPWLRIVHTLAQKDALDPFEKPQIIAYIESLSCEQ